MTGERSRLDIAFALLILVVGFTVSFIYYQNLWMFDADGLSVVSKKLPYWDFTNLWAGGALASEGKILTIFDVETYRAALRSMFNPNLPDQEWSYPPSILLIGVPLSYLPISWAYALWTFGTIALLHCALRALRLPLIAHVACLISPSGTVNAMLGQNGALTAALLIGGLLLCTSRPILAGALFGLLTIKPHLGLLIPVCLIVSGNYRAFISAAATAALLFVATGAAFGFDVWQFFMSNTVPLMSAIMEAPYPQSYHSHAMTIFVFGRWLGLSIGGAYILQGIAFLACAAVVALIWRPASAMEHARRVCITATLSIIATPYGYSYDTIPMCVTVALLFVTERRISKLLLGFVWLYPLAVHLVNNEGIGIGVAVPIILATVAFFIDSRKSPASALLTKASSTPPARSDGLDPCAGSGRRAGGSGVCSGGGS